MQTENPRNAIIKSKQLHVIEVLLHNFTSGFNDDNFSSRYFYNKIVYHLAFL